MCYVQDANTYSQPAKQSPRVPGIKPYKGDTQILYETEITEYTEVISHQQQH